MMISNVIDAPAVPQSQSRFAPRYHHPALHTDLCEMGRQDCARAARDYPFKCGTVDSGESGSQNLGEAFEGARCTEQRQRLMLTLCDSITSVSYTALDWCMQICVLYVNVNSLGNGAFIGVIPLPFWYC